MRGAGAVPAGRTSEGGWPGQRNILSGVDAFVTVAKLDVFSASLPLLFSGDTAAERGSDREGWVVGPLHERMRASVYQIRWERNPHLCHIKDRDGATHRQ
jgi:hypothetical protein